jgi:hypothetical protein
VLTISSRDKLILTDTLLKCPENDLSNGIQNLNPILSDFVVNYPSFQRRPEYQEVKTIKLDNGLCQYDVKRFHKMESLNSGKSQLNTLQEHIQ